LGASPRPPCSRALFTYSVAAAPATGTGGMLKNSWQLAAAAAACLSAELEAAAVAAAMMSAYASVVWAAAAAAATVPWLRSALLGLAVGGAQVNSCRRKEQPRIPSWC
jgi:hypothetical protein